jgi:hypothetical protein
MRLLRITSVSRSYTRQFFERHPELLHSSYAEIKRALAADKSVAGTAYAAALSGLGYLVLDVLHNVEPLQLAWARERGLATRDLRTITLEQARQFRPDILWFDSADRELMDGLRAVLPKLRLAVGWEGSALSSGGVWPLLDLVLSCAPESVDRLRSLGLRSEHLHHGFDPGIASCLQDTPKDVAVSFAGSLIRRAHYHLRREALLVRLMARVPLRIYTPAATAYEYCKVFAAGAMHAGLATESALGLDASRLPHAFRRSASPFRWPVNPALRRYCRPPVFGLRYFQSIRDSLVGLNVHADSSPRFASNMRLFEVAGTGTCLLTDARPNLASLFEPEREVVTYQNEQDCAEKAQWLMEHTVEAAAIGARCRQRVLAEHTVPHRAREFDALLRRVM